MPKAGKKGLSDLYKIGEMQKRMIDTIIKSYDSAAFVQDLEKLKGQILVDEAANQKMSPVVKKITAKLKEYPGIEQEILSEVNKAIASATRLGVLDKIKERAMPVKREKKTKADKKTAA